MQEAIVEALKKHDGDKSFYSYFGIPVHENEILYDVCCSKEEESFDDLK